MTEMVTQASRALLAAYDFSRFRKIVDVGGGQGALLAAILNRNAGARGVLLELPRVIESTKKVLDPGVTRRIELVPGDFFKAVPVGGDLYILNDIIHDWNESQSREILRVCRQAMNGSGVLLIIEHVVCGPNKLCRGKLIDMGMMVVLGGRNRTEQEYADILKSSGFQTTRIVATGGSDIIEAVPR